MAKQRFLVSLEGFSFDVHVMKGRPPSLTRAPDAAVKKATKAVVWAESDAEAEGLFKRAMGINRTERDYKVQRLGADAEVAEFVELHRPADSKKAG